MELLSNLALGFSVSLHPLNILFCFVGVSLGVVIGILPGLGSAATIALLLPITYFMHPTTAIIMLAGIWYGSMYGGSITSILLRVPGESASVMVAIDGYELTKKGRAGAALGISMFSAFIAGVFGLLGLTFVAPTLAEFALSFGPPEYFALTLLGLTLVSYLATTTMWKAAVVTIIGLLLGTVGLDPVRSMERFTFGSLTLQGGIELVPLVMGLFGISEVFHMIETRLSRDHTLYGAAPTAISKIFPTRQDWSDARRPIAQGTLVGFFVGLLPGGGATISSYVAYAVAKRWSRKTACFGSGDIGGVAAPEAAANAATCSGFIPLLTLGLPENVVMALMLSAFLLQGITPGPTLLTQHPDMFWGIITSMFIGNCILVLVMLPLIGFLSKITLIPSNVLVGIIVLACLAGAYGVNNNPADIVTMTAFGLLGYLMNKFGFPQAPMVLAFVLGPIMETALRQSLIMSDANPFVFWARPVSGTLMVIFMIVMGMPLIRLAWTIATKYSRRGLTALTLIAVIALISAAEFDHSTQARAQGYPEKPINIIVPYPAGGRTDLTARTVAQFLKPELGQSIVVINRPGASGVIGAREVARAAPNGYTLGLFSTGFLTAQYTVPTPTNVNDYEFIALVNMDPAAVAVSGARDWKDLPALVKYGAENPKKLRVGINSGSSAHIFAAAFMQKTGIDAIYVPFRGGSERSVALAGGHIDVDFDIVASMKTMLDARKVHILGIAAERRSEDYPVIPTMRENGVDLVISSWHGLFAPRGTPPAVIENVSRAVKSISGNPEFIERMHKLQLGIQYLDHATFREFFVENDKMALALIRSLDLYVPPAAVTETP